MSQIEDEKHNLKQAFVINARPDIRDMSVSDLIPWADNPRGIEPEAMEGLRSSLEKFGYVDLIVVNKRNMQVVSGHQRLKVLKAACIDIVPCVMVDLDDLAQQALAVTMNNDRIAGYFTAALIPILDRLKSELPEEYLTLRLKELRDEVEHFEVDQEGLTAADDIPEAPKEAITKPGDLWILGDHRLLCGDSTKDADVARLMDGHTAQILATDPPYCIDYTGADRPNGGKDWSDVYHEVDIKDAVGFWTAFLKAGLKVCDPSSAIYFWYASCRHGDVERTFKAVDILFHQQIIWVKPCMNLTFSVYPWRHEPCAFGWVRGNKPFFRVKRKSAGTVWYAQFLRSCDPDSPQAHTDVWEVDYEGRKRAEPGMHPTVKPVEVFAIPMRVHTHPGDICYEPFSGSGSQIMAAERTGRRCFAMEIEPVFVDVAVRRWEEFTGKKARLA